MPPKYWHIKNVYTWLFKSGHKYNKHTVETNRGHDERIRKKNRDIHWTKI